MDSLASRNICRSSAFSAAWSDGVLWLLRAAMCVRELNFRLLLRGLRADSMFAYWSKSSRVSVPLMRMLYPMGHYCSTGFVRSVSLASVKKGGLGWNGLLPFGEYVASSGLLILASPQQARAFQNFGLFSTGSSPVRALLYRYFHFI